MTCKRTKTNNLTDIARRRKSNGIRERTFTGHSMRHKYFNPRQGKADICRVSADTSKIHKLQFSRLRRGNEEEEEEGRVLGQIFFWHRSTPMDHKRVWKQSWSAGRAVGASRK